MSSRFVPVLIYTLLLAFASYNFVQSLVLSNFNEMNRGISRGFGYGLYHIQSASAALGVRRSRDDCSFTKLFSSLSSSVSHNSKYNFNPYRATTIALPIEPTVNRALLISSYTDGVLPNEKAHNFIRNSLLLKFTSDKLEELEDKIESSARLAPCCGPNARLITDMEELDEEVQQLKDLTHQESSEIPDQIIEKNGDLVLRLIYIPTALYALRPDSSNTPGKQRQRARYDAKQRRQGLESFLIDLFDSEDDDITVNVVAVTLDLDDGSIKQASCSKEGSKVGFPKDGKEALISWSPDMIYVEGGNTFWLQHCIEKGDWNEDLISACSGSNGAFYCGKSAGAIIAGNTVETATWKEMDDPRVVPGKEEYGDWKGVSGLGLTGGLNIFPHMAEKWSEVVSEQDLKNVVHLSDEEVCCVDGIENEATMLSPVEDSSIPS